jgi:CheY-like chemotaxis protein
MPPGHAHHAKDVGLANDLTSGSAHPVTPLHQRSTVGRHLHQPRQYDHERVIEPDASQPTRTPRVLLVDDTAAVRVVLRGLLEDAGVEVVGEAADGLEGIARAEALRPDVVLMDWRMPRLDGVQATARIRLRLPEVQVVMFSLVEGEQAEAVARQAGASAFLPKGVSVEQICAAVLAVWHRPSPS